MPPLPQGLKKQLTAPKVQERLGPAVRLACSHNQVFKKAWWEGVPKERQPALLVAYPFTPNFFKHRPGYSYRDWVMDSGAFSAFNSGMEIKLQDYIDCCKRLMAEDPTLTEVYSLDVIGDWQASLRNTEEMWRQGVEAIPCYHFNEPWSALLGMAKDYPKIALGGVAAKAGKMKWAQQCFARIWPKKVHGFAFGTPRALEALPFHSVDSTNWELRPGRFGIWDCFGHGARIPARGADSHSPQAIKLVVDYYLELEVQAQRRWHKEMLEICKPPVPKRSSLFGD